MKKINNNLLIVEVPEDSEDFHIIHRGTRVAYFKPDYKRFDLLEGKFKIVGKLSKILEEDCKRFVDKYSKLLPIKYWNYNNKGYHCYTENELDTAKESLISLLQANDIDTSNEDKLLIIEVL